MGQAVSDLTQAATVLGRADTADLSARQLDVLTAQEGISTQLGSGLTQLGSLQEELPAGAQTYLANHGLLGDAADVVVQATRSGAMVTAVRTGITSLADALVSVSVVLTVAILGAGAAGADPSQQDQFLALLEQEQIPPANDGEVAGVVARAHYLCGQLNGGTPVDALVNEEMNGMYADNPRLHFYPDRVRRSVVRFITASVDVYCPSHQRELPPYE